MNRRKLRFAVFGNEYQERKADVVARLIDTLAGHGAEIAVDKPFFKSLSDSPLVSLDGISVFEGNDFEADFVVSMGGDGTFLKAAGRVGSRQIPIIGINMGRLGFLADVPSSQVEGVIDAVCRGNYAIERHAVLQAFAEGEPLAGLPYALNDIAILKRDNASMISIRATVDGEYLATYQADGLIVSTPTGSTAYSLSNGGPIMMPLTSVICLTPVAPHSLSIRPIVVNDTAEITLSVESRSHNFLVAIDGRSEKLAESTTLTVRKAPYTVDFVKFQGQNYLATLREKMMWGTDTRD
ncbi:MAG: NAD kinase [Prevotella sp.]|nr:NAD kinase [Prevotella sp.]